jgi:hypothetical protein
MQSRGAFYISPESTNSISVDDLKVKESKNMLFSGVTKKI